MPVAPLIVTPPDMVIVVEVALGSKLIAVKIIPASSKTPIISFFKEILFEKSPRNLKQKNRPAA